MTNEKIYAEIVAMLKEYEKWTGRDNGTLDDTLANTAEMERLAAFTACPNIYASAARIILHLREKMDKKANSSGRVNVCKRLVKTIDENGKNLLGGIHETGGKYCILDGYRAFRFSEDLSSVRRAEAPFDFDAAFPQVDRETVEQLPTVSRAEIKEFISMHGITRSKPGNKPISPAAWPQWYAVNPFYLLDVLDAVPDAVFYLPESYCKPLYFADADGNDGILLPVRTKKAVEEWHKYQEEKKNAERRSA